MTRILFGPLLVLVFVLSAAVLSPSRPAAKNTLNLPATPYRYANVELPAHFTQPGRNHDNTPPDNPLSDDGATLRPSASAFPFAPSHPRGCRASSKT